MIEFVSYTGKYPNRCSGILTIKKDGEEYRFGCEKGCLPTFWYTGGSCDWNNVKMRPWRLIKLHLTDEWKEYGEELIDVFNKNVVYGCCGGCN